MSMPQKEIDEHKFSSKELHEIERLKATINNRGSSLMEKQIAEATLDDLMRSKEPPPHSHKPRYSEEESSSGSGNIYRQDEAFEKYEMGNNPSSPPGSKVENQAIGDLHSVKFNHKARGTAKTKQEDTFHEAEM